MSGYKDKFTSTAAANTFCIGAVWAGNFCRTISLGYTPEQKQISASFTNGVLTVKIKKPQSFKSEPIRISSSSN